MTLSRMVFILCVVLVGTFRYSQAAAVTPPATSIDFDVPLDMVGTVTVKFVSSGSLGVGRVEEWSLAPVVFAAHIITDCKKDIHQSNEVFFSGTPLSFNYGPGSYSVYPMSLDACPSTVRRPAYINLTSYSSDPTHPANTTAIYDADLGAEHAIITVVMQGIGTGDPGSGARSGKMHGGKQAPGEHHHSCCCCCSGDWGCAIHPNSGSNQHENEWGSQVPGRLGTEPSEPETPSALPPGLYPQEKENWCWAAVSKSAIEQIATATVEECALASEAYDIEPCPNYGFHFWTGTHVEGSFTAREQLSVDPIKMAMGPTNHAVPWFVEWIDGSSRPLGGHYMMILDATPAPVFAATGGGIILTVFDPLPLNEGDVFMISTNDLRRPGGARFQSVEYFGHESL
jgi:hypothetical protein